VLQNGAVSRPPPCRRHPYTAAAQLLDDAVMQDVLADHLGDAWPSGRFILRAGDWRVNEWRPARA
jgi:hypothetical protein